MIPHLYTYQSTLRDALKVNWRVEDLIGGDKLLDFTKPFLPDSLTGVNDIQCLNYQEKLALNQIRGICSMLKHHWMEEAQHTKMDTLLVGQLTRKMSFQEIETGIEDYLAIAKILDQALLTQVQLDLESLSKATGRTFTDAEKWEIQAIQEQSYRWAFLCAGMTHPNFVKILSELSQTGQVRVTELAKALS